MKVLKFGGTSVGSAQRMKDVAKLITGERNIVVLSAMSGTTNSLVEISDYLYKKNPDGANEVINKLAQKYYGHIEELYSTDEYKQKAKELIKHHFDHIRTFTKDLFTLFEEKVVLAQGELISTGMMNLYLNECGINSVLIPALDYMRTDKNAEPEGDKKKMQEAFECLYAQAEKKLEEIAFDEYSEVLFISKSVGTIIASAYAEKYKIKCCQILYTPLEQTFMFEHDDAIAFIGTADPWSDVKKVIACSKNQAVPIYVYEDANHSLEKENILQNIDILKNVMEKTQKYLR